jgi:hypothetical protein|tara:strand:+ start:239 stop:490 length:252 start_codon:yes stop_codon:yes gene_type:complete
MNTLEKDIYKKKIDKSYYLTLNDLLLGVTYEELIQDMFEFEKKEMYELCEGIKKALLYAEEKTYKEIKIEVENYESRNQSIEY